jgi:hypothetical protein
MQLGGRVRGQGYGQAAAGHIGIILITVVLLFRPAVAGNSIEPTSERRPDGGAL